MPINDPQRNEFWLRKDTPQDVLDKHDLNFLYRVLRVDAGDDNILITNPLSGSFAIDWQDFLDSYELDIRAVSEAIAAVIAEQTEDARIIPRQPLGAPSTRSRRLQSEPERRHAEQVQNALAVLGYQVIPNTPAPSIENLVEPEDGPKESLPVLSFWERLLEEDN